MEEIDTDKNGAIDFSEFLHFMTTERNSRKLSSDASDYGDIFDFMDINKNGFISADDLKKVNLSKIIFSFNGFPDHGKGWTESDEPRNRGDGGRGHERGRLDIQRTVSQLDDPPEAPLVVKIFPEISICLKIILQVDLSDYNG